MSVHVPSAYINSRVTFNVRADAYRADAVVVIRRD